MKILKAPELPNFEWLKEALGIDADDLVSIFEGPEECVKFCAPDYETIELGSEDSEGNFIPDIVITPTSF